MRLPISTALMAASNPLLPLFAPARSRAGSASTPYLSLHHRLDVETSGVVLLATDPAANAGLARAFSEHEVEKIYHAVGAHTPQGMTLDALLALIRGAGKIPAERDSFYNVVRRFD